MYIAKRATTSEEGVERGETRSKMLCYGCGVSLEHVCVTPIRHGDQGVSTHILGGSEPI